VVGGFCDDHGAMVKAGEVLIVEIWFGVLAEVFDCYFEEVYYEVPYLIENYVDTLHI